MTGSGPERDAPCLRRSGRWAPGQIVATLRRVAVLAIALGAAACATPAPPGRTLAHADRQVLWRIVHGRCSPNQRLHHDPAPCAVVARRERGGGFALLKDRIGRAQFLLIPTGRITGIEDPKLLEPGATNYFAEAWNARRLVEERLGDRASTRMSVTVNSAFGRSQDQLHLHIDCLGGAVRSALDDVGETGRAGWSERAVVLEAHNYRVRWLTADDLVRRDPFALLAAEVPGARANMGSWTLALTGATARDGSAGLLLLAHRADPAAGDRGSAEELQDHDCR